MNGKHEYPGFMRHRLPSSLGGQQGAMPVAYVKEAPSFHHMNGMLKGKKKWYENIFKHLKQLHFN
jgi:hypothetical protein